ncbi:MAG: hypothetical protein M3069_08330 [Chloroflexota bacterium]|nr:hypothetical protein [Chloroflexota bacterium]
MPTPIVDKVPFRQIHPDFHTSPAIRDVAAEFDPTAFARTFKQAHQMVAFEP